MRHEIAALTRDGLKRVKAAAAGDFGINREALCLYIKAAVLQLHPT
jgi:hypothetical protein